MHAEQFRSAYRTVLGILILYVVWMTLPHAMNYFNFVVGGTRRLHQEREAAQRKAEQANQLTQSQKMTGPKLEAALRQANRLGPDAQLRCRASQGWDYVCSYLPTALPSPQRLHFGVNVDAKRWVKVSQVVPVSTPLPKSD